jgi:protein SCO1/2
MAYLRLRLLLLAALAALALAGCGAHTFKGTVLEPPNEAPDFTLTDQSGQPFRLSEQRGNVVMLFFGFTNCPDVCPTAMADAAAVKRQLGADGERLKVALISVDPERDTPELMGRYVKMFDPSFIGLSGAQAELDPVIKAYGVTAVRRDLPGSALKYTMDHSAFLYVIDQTGQWRLVFSPDATVSDIASDVGYLLKNGGS